MNMTMLLRNHFQAMQNLLAGIAEWKLQNNMASRCEYNLCHYQSLQVYFSNQNLIKSLHLHI